MDLSVLRDATGISHLIEARGEHAASHISASQQGKWKLHTDLTENPSSIVQWCLGWNGCELN